MSAACFTLTLLAVAVTASSADMSDETRAVLLIAQDASRPWRARAGALRTIARADDVDPAALAGLAALVAEAEPAVLRRLALSAMSDTDAAGSRIGAATAAALRDADAGVRREALRVTADRASLCEGAAAGAIAALRDTEELNRVFAARATRELALSGCVVLGAATPLLELLDTSAATPAAAATLLLVQPAVETLAPHAERLAALTRDSARPLPAALVLATWAGRNDEAWRAYLAAHAIEGEPAVRQGAHAALAWCAPESGAVETHVRHATQGPDSAVIVAALRAPCHGPEARKIRARTAESLLRHGTPLVRRLAVAARKTQ